MPIVPLIWYPPDLDPNLRLVKCTTVPTSGVADPLSIHRFFFRPYLPSCCISKMFAMDIVDIHHFMPGSLIWSANNLASHGAHTNGASMR